MILEFCVLLLFLIPLCIGGLNKLFHPTMLYVSHRTFPDGQIELLIRRWNFLPLWGSRIETWHCTKTLGWGREGDGEQVDTDLNDRFSSMVLSGELRKRS